MFPGRIAKWDNRPVFTACIGTSCFVVFEPGVRSEWIERVSVGEFQIWNGGYNITFFFDEGAGRLFNSTSSAPGTDGFDCCVCGLIWVTLRRLDMLQYMRSSNGSVYSRIPMGPVLMSCWDVLHTNVPKRYIVRYKFDWLVSLCLGYCSG